MLWSVCRDASRLRHLTASFDSFGGTPSVAGAPGGPSLRANFRNCARWIPFVVVMGRWGLALLFLAACSSAGPVAVPTASPSPATSSPAASPSPAQSSTYAIVFVPGPSPFDSAISVIDNRGHVVATAPFDTVLYQPAWQARPGSLKPNSVMSSTSASRTRLYYLYGGSEVRFIALDGSTGT